MSLVSVDRWIRSWEAACPVFGDGGGGVDAAATAADWSEGLFS